MNSGKFSTFFFFFWCWHVLIFERRQTVGESQTTGGLQWGFALPGAPTGTNDEYIGYLVGSLRTGRKGWSGISHGGGMPNSLLMVAWPDGDNVKTKFVYAG